MSEMVCLGTEDSPIADLVRGHISKSTFRELWSAEWEGDAPTDLDIEYQYAMPEGWRLDVDATTPGAVSVTVFTW